MFKFLVVGRVIREQGGYWGGSWPNDRWVPGKVKVDRKCLTPEDTGILIFSVGQKKELQMFLKEKAFKILYKSKPAYNSIHPGIPRNTVVVFELA